MKRRNFLAGMAVGSAAISAPAIAQGGPEIQWRLTSNAPKSLDTIYGTTEHIARRVAAATNGRFRIQTFAAGEIVPATAVLDAVQNQTVEMGHTASSFHIGKDPTFAIDTALPFGLNARQQSAWMYQGGGLELMREFFRNYQVFVMPAGNSGAQMGGWFRREVNTLDDLKGLKLRIGGLASQVFQRLGAVPQQIAPGEIYPALEKGTIDAAEWIGPYDDEKLGLQKVAKYYYYPGFWEGNTQTSLYVNLSKWATVLSPALSCEFELCLVVQDGVGDDDQLSGDGDESHLGRLAGRAQAHVERFEARIVTCGGDRRHVERIADALAAAPDPAQASELSAVGVEGSQAGEGCDLLGRERAEFRDQGEQGGGRDRPNAGDRAQPAGFLREDARLFHQTRDLGIPARNLGIEPLPMRFDVCAQRSIVAFGQPGALLLAHLHELIPPLVGARERFAFWVAFALARKRQALRHRRQHPRVDAVGLGEPAGGTGEVAGAGRVDPGKGDALGLQRPAQAGIVMAGRLKQHEAVMPAPHEARQAFRGIGHTFGAAALKHIKMMFGHVDSDEARV